MVWRWSWDFWCWKDFDFMFFFRLKGTHGNAERSWFHETGLMDWKCFSSWKCIFVSSTRMRCYSTRRRKNRKYSNVVNENVGIKVSCAGSWWTSDRFISFMFIVYILPSTGFGFFDSFCSFWRTEISVFGNCYEQMAISWFIKTQTQNFSVSFRS